MKIETITEAADLLCSMTEAVSSEMCELSEAYGRILAEDVDAVLAVPYFRRSAYDGYALRSEDTIGASEDAPVVLKVTEALAAGDIPQYEIGRGYAARIMTGAAVPEGADAVVMHERTIFTEEEVRLTAPVKPGNIVQIGEDVHSGVRILDQGKCLGSSDIALLAGQGISKVKVYRKPVAAIVSTGSELLSPQQSPEYGKIYDTNPYLLGGYLRKYGVMPVHSGIVSDDPKKLSEVIEKALLHSDIVITTGGVSAGDYDYLPEVIENIGGELLFHRIRLKPGGAMLAARKDGKLILSLSGNPGAAATGLLCVGLPCIKKLCGRSKTDFRRAKARLTEAFGKSCPVMRVLKGKSSYQDGMLYFTPLENQRNGSVSSMDDCDLLAMVPEGAGPLEKGTMLEVCFI